MTTVDSCCVYVLDYVLDDDDDIDDDEDDDDFDDEDEGDEGDDGDEEDEEEPETWQVSLNVPKWTVALKRPAVS